MGSHPQVSFQSSGVNQSGHPSNTRTPHKTRHTYERFSEEAEMQIVRSHDLDLISGAGGTTSEVRTSTEADVENHTPKVIVQTRSFSVEYENGLKGRK
jgi:hypothetical protein